MMWKETEVLQKIVSDNAQLSHNTGSIHLQEKDSSAKLCSVFVDHVSEDGITLKLDYDSESFFKNNFGNRRCDYVVLSKAKTDRVALFIDMKSTSLSEVDAVECFPHKLEHGYPNYVPQLRSSSCFLDFLHVVMKEFCLSNALTPYIKRKRKHRFFVVLHTKDMSAINRPVSRTRPRNNNTPETALILHVENNQHLDFSSLVLS